MMSCVYLRYLNVVAGAVLASVTLAPFPKCTAQVSNETKSTEGVATIDWSKSVNPKIETFVRPNPAEYEDAINAKRRILRVRVTINSSTSVEFYEQPKDIDYYDSSIVVLRDGQSSHIYNVGKLIEHQALSLAHVAIVPAGNGAGVLICEYESGAVGAREGFAILRFSPKGLELHTLPLTDFGKVVIFRAKPWQAEIWSALHDDAGSDADPMTYTTRMCRWQSRKGYTCGLPRRKPQRFAPSAIDDPGIEIR